MANERQYVVFYLANQPYAAAIDLIKEVTYMTTITRLPNTPTYVDGVMDLRGEVLPVIDLRKRLGLAERAHDANTRLMILNLGERSTALVVDRVDQVVTLADEGITAPDSAVIVAGQEYVIGVARADGRLLVLLDVSALMDLAA
jgi:purine-binding chemotaxis protein CheW